MLFGTIGEAIAEEGKLVHPIAREATESQGGPWEIQWFDQDLANLLQEMDFL